MSADWEVVGRAPLQPQPAQQGGGDDGWGVVGREPMAPAASGRRQVGFGEASSRFAQSRLLGYGRTAAEAVTAGPGATALGVLVDRARGVAPGSSVAAVRDFFAAPQRDLAIQPQAEELTTGGKLGAGVGALAVDLPVAIAAAPRSAASLFTAGTPAQVARQRTQAEFTRGVGAMAAPAALSGVDRAREMEAAGVDPVAAALAGATTAGTTALTGGVAATVPATAASAIGRGLQRAAVGFPAAGVTNEIVRQAENQAAVAAGAPQAARQFDSVDAVVEALPQTFFSVFLGPRAVRTPPRESIAGYRPQDVAAERAAAQQAAASAEAFAAARQDPAVAAFLDANNIQSPDDPRVVAAVERIAARREREAAAAAERATVGPNADPDAVAAVRESIAAGQMDPAAAPWAGRTPDPALPPVIELGTDRVAPMGRVEETRAIDDRGLQDVERSPVAEAVVRSNVGDAGTAEGVRANLVDDGARVARAYAAEGIDPAGVQRDFDLARTRAERPDDVRRLRGQSALSDSDAALAARSAGLAVEDVRMLSPEGQQRLLEKARREQATQARGDAAGPLATTDTGSPDGASSPASRPNVPGDRMPLRGAAEDRTARPMLSEAEVADLRQRYTDEPAFRREVQRATERRQADMQRLDAARAQREALDRSEELAGLRRRRDTVADLTPKESARLDALEAQRARLNDSIFNLEERIYRAEDPANLGARSASGVGDRPFRTRGDEARDDLGGREGDYRQRAEEQSRRARQEEIDRLEREWAERQRMRDAADAQRREQEGARAADQGQDAAARKAAEGRAGEKAQPPDPQTGRYAVDERGFVVSDRGGPVWFNHQRDAARWILTVGNRARGGQVWQIANHPDRRGFTVEQTRVNEPPPGGDAPRGGENQARPADAPPSLGAGTLSANPFVDPKLWMSLARDVGGGVKTIVQALRNTFGWADREAQAWSNQMHDLTKALSNRQRGDGGVSMLSAVLLSNDGVRRTLARRFKSPTITKVADLFFAPGGGERAIGATYHEAISDVAGRRLNELRDLLKPLHDMPALQRDEALAAVGRLLAGNGRIEKGTPIGDAALGVRKMLKEMHAYMREAGMDVGEIKTNYYPRVENTAAILADPSGFVKAARQAYMANGLPSDVATRMADEWLQRVMLGDLGVRVEGNDFVGVGAGVGDAKPTRSRELNAAADKILDAYYLRDPESVLTRYVLGTVQRAEWSRRMGGEKWNEMKAAIIKEGGAAALPDIVKSIQSEVGLMAGITGRARSTLSGMHALQSLAFLDRAVIASLAEPVIAGIRSGNAFDSLRSIASTARQWVPWLRTAKDADRRALAEDLGLILSAMDSGALAARFGMEAQGEVGRFVQTQFFAKTGLEQFTNASRIASMEIGQVFIRRLANEAGSAKAKILLRELGIADADQAAFTKFVRGLNDGADFITQLKGAQGDQYRVALRRFTEQTVMNPNGAHKPRYAQHPLGSLAYGLMGYLYAFQKNVVQRSLLVARQAARSDAGAAEKASMMASAAMLPALVPIAYLMGELRSVLFTDPARRDEEKPLSDKLLTALSRSGLLGALDLPLNAVLGVRYDKNPATILLGPVIGGISDLFMKISRLFTDKNADGTNTQERQAARAVYDIVLSPIANAGASVLPGTPLGTALGASVIYSGTMPSAREGFVQMVAGPPKQTGAGASNTARGAGAQNRGAGTRGAGTGERGAGTR